MTQSVRRRLSPEERRNQLLDCARQIVLERGLSTLTMERLASEAGVSHPLIYKYFDTRLQLLQELLVREYKAFQQSFTQAEPRVGGYREVLRGYVDINFRQFAGGELLGILLAQADVSQVIKDQSALGTHRFSSMNWCMSSRSPRIWPNTSWFWPLGRLAAAEHYSRIGGDREEQIDQTVSFILGGIEQILNARPLE